jgi:transposase-like protein
LYTKELREEAARLVVDEKLGFREVSRRLSLPQSTLVNWVRAFRAEMYGYLRISTKSFCPMFRKFQLYNWLKNHVFILDV